MPLGFTTVEYTSSLINPINVGTDGNTRFFADVNGDRKADFCRQVGQATEGRGFISCALAGSSNFSSIEYGIAENMPYIDLGYSDRVRTFADVNGDGKADFCRMVGNDAVSNPHRPSCLLAGNTGFSSIEYTSSLTSPINVGPDGNTRFFADVNGDRKADFCRQVVQATEGWKGFISCVLAGLNGFTSIEYGVAENMPYIDLGYSARVRTFADVNGDGKADFCRMIGNDAGNDIVGNPHRPSCLLAGNTNIDVYNPNTQGVYDLVTQQVALKGLPIGNVGQVCVDPKLTFDPTNQAIYNTTNQKSVAINVTTCSSAQICLEPWLSSFDPSNNKVIGLKQPFGSIGQVCVDPKLTFDPTNQAIYNTTSQKSVSKNAIVCNNTQICSESGNDGDISLTTKHNSDSIAMDWASFAFGITAGAFGIIAIAGISYAIYKHCNVLPLAAVVPWIPQPEDPDQPGLVAQVNAQDI